MAKKKVTPTATAKAFDAAKKEYKAAQERFAKTKHEKDEALVKAAKQKLSNLAPTVNRERFVKIAGGRAGKAIAAITQLENCTNRRQYEYNAQDADEIINAITDAVANLRKKFLAALNTETKTQGQKTNSFSFSREQTSPQTGAGSTPPAN